MRNSPLKEILIVLVTLFFACIFFQFGKDKFLIPKSIEQTEEDSLVKRNMRIEENIRSEKKATDSLLLLLNNEERKLISLKEQQHEKASYINTTNDEQLLEFFSSFETKSTTD